MKAYLKSDWPLVLFLTVVLSLFAVWVIYTECCTPPDTRKMTGCVTKCDKASGICACVWPRAGLIAELAALGMDGSEGPDHKRPPGCGTDPTKHCAL